MAIHYLTSRQAQRVGRAVNEVESFGQRSEFKQENLQAQNALIVSIVSDIETRTSGTGFIMRGSIDAINFTDDTVVVWNLSEKTLPAGEVVLAVWTLSENSSGMWVSIFPSFSFTGGGSDVDCPGGETDCLECSSNVMPGTVTVKVSGIADLNPPPNVQWVIGIANQLNGTHKLVAIARLDPFCARGLFLVLSGVDPFKFAFLTISASSVGSFWFFQIFLLDEDKRFIAHPPSLTPKQDGYHVWVGAQPVIGELDCSGQEVLTDPGSPFFFNNWELSGATIIVNPDPPAAAPGGTFVENLTPDFEAIVSNAPTLSWDDFTGSTWDVYLTKTGDGLTLVSEGQGTKTYAASGLTAGAKYIWNIVGHGGTDESYGFNIFRVLHDMYGTITVEGNSTVTTISSSSSDFSNKVQVTVFDTDGAESDVNADHTNDHITITTGGTYQCEARVSVSGTATDKISLAIFKNNGATQLGPRATNAVFAAAETIAISSGPIVLSATDTVELWCQNEDSTNDFTIQDGSLTVYRVG